MLFATTLLFIVSCGAQTDSNPQEELSSQVGFKKLTPEQTNDVCQWVSTAVIQEKFELAGAKMDPPQTVGGLTHQCTQRAVMDNNGVMLTLHVRPFDDEEVYNTMLEAAQYGVKLQKLKTIKVGVYATISHTTIPNTGITTSILQAHGSSYGIDLTSQYKGTMNEAAIEKAMVEIVKAFIDKNP